MELNKPLKCFYLMAMHVPLRRSLAMLLLCSLLLHGCNSAHDREIEEIEQRTAAALARIERGALVFKTVTPAQLQAQQEHEAVMQAMADRKKAAEIRNKKYDKILAEQKPHLAKRYDRGGLRVLQYELEDFKKRLADTEYISEEEWLKEDVDELLIVLKREEEELARFQKVLCTLPPDAGLQWDEDFYYKKDAAKTAAMLPGLKREIEQLVAEHKEVLVTSSYPLVKAAAQAAINKAKAKPRS